MLVILRTQAHPAVESVQEPSAKQRVCAACRASQGANSLHTEIICLGLHDMSAQTTRSSAWSCWHCASAPPTDQTVSGLCLVSICSSTFIYCRLQGVDRGGAVGAAVRPIVLMCFIYLVATQVSAGFKELTVEELAALRSNPSDGTYLLDVRTTEEFGELCLASTPSSAGIHRQLGRGQCN